MALVQTYRQALVHLHKAMMAVQQPVLVLETGEQAVAVALVALVRVALAQEMVVVVKQTALPPLR